MADEVDRGLAVGESVPEPFVDLGLSAKTHSASLARMQPSQEPPSTLPEHLIFLRLQRLH